MEFVGQRLQYAKPGIGRAYWDYRDREIIKRIDKRDQHILDVGCGEGIILEKLFGKFPHILGVDKDSANVRTCFSYGLPALPGNVYELHFPTNSMDCVIFTEVIEHLTVPWQALAEIRRVLRPGGRVIVLFPNDRNFFISRMLCGKWKEAFAPSGHVWKFTPRKVRGMLIQTGFKICERANLPLGFPWFASLHCLIVGVKK